MRNRPIATGLATGLALLASLTVTGCTQVAAQSKVMVVNAIDSPTSKPSTTVPTSRQRALRATAVGLGGPLAVKSGGAYVGETSAQVLLRPGGLPGSRLGGDATFVLTSKTHDLTVTLRLSGLIPGVQYRAAITDPAGRVLSELAPVVPTRGKPAQGTSVTLIRNVTRIQPSWCVVVDQV